MWTRMLAGQKLSGTVKQKGEAYPAISRVLYRSRLK
jgi:hypothetical protein